MMAPIERDKYMDASELNRLRAVTEAHAIIDLKAGRMRGILTWCVVDLALGTGLRVSELAKIRVGDFDLKRRSLRVWRHKRKKHERETVAIGKALGEHLRQFIEWKRLVGQKTGKDAPLFVGKRGGLTPSGLQRIWITAVKRAGLPERLSIHSARHTIAVHMLKRTGNLRMVQKQLGHASPATTANMYADVSFEDMQNALDGLYQTENGGGK